MTTSKEAQKSAALFSKAESLREHHQISISDFCESVGVTRATYYNLLEDGRGPTSFEHVSRTAEFIKQNEVTGQTT